MAAKKRTTQKRASTKSNKSANKFKPRSPFSKWGLLVVMVVFGVIGAKLLWSAFAAEPNHVKYYGPSEATRPTYQDVSYKLIGRVHEGEPYMYYRGHTATQTERDAMEETLFAVALPHLYRYLESMGCSTHKLISGQMGAVTTRLGNDYENKTIITGGDWSIPTGGRHYSFERYALINARDQCALKSQAAACAQNGIIQESTKTSDKNLLHLLDIRIENGLCVDSADFKLPAVSGRSVEEMKTKCRHFKDNNLTEEQKIEICKSYFFDPAEEFCPDGTDASCRTYCPQRPGVAGVFEPERNFFKETCNTSASNRRKARGNLAPVSGDTEYPIASLTVKQIELVHATHAAHKKVSDFRCGVGAAPEQGIVQKAHLELEKTAVDDRQHHFLRMKDFSGTVDPFWTKEEECKIARFQDVAHERWMNAVLALNWVEARTADADHQNAHIIMNIRDSRLQFRISCGLRTQNGLYTRSGSCPKNLTEADILDNPPHGFAVIETVAATPPASSNEINKNDTTNNTSEEKDKPADTKEITEVDTSTNNTNSTDTSNGECNASNYYCYTDHSVNPCKAYKSSTAKTNPIISSYGFECTSTSDRKY